MVGLISFLIVKTSSLGDILQTFPVVATLKKAFPDCTIDWVVEKGGSALIESHPQIDNAIIVDSKTWGNLPSLFQQIKNVREKKYDVLFDMQSNSKSALITLLAKAKRKIGFGVKTRREWPNLLVTNEKYDCPIGRNRRLDYLYLVESAFKIAPVLEEKVELKISKEEMEFLKTLPTSPTLVAPGSMWKNKTVKNEQLAQFLTQLEGPFLFSWGSITEKETVTALAEQVGGTVLPKLSLPLLQRVMGQCKLVVSADSLPLHLAGTAGVPTYSYFGPSSSQVFRPLGPLHQSIQGNCPYGETFDQRCRFLRTCKDAPCINQLNLLKLTEKNKES